MLNSGALPVARSKPFGALAYPLLGKMHLMPMPDWSVAEDGSYPAAGMQTCGKWRVAATGNPLGQRGCASHIESLRAA